MASKAYRLRSDDPTYTTPFATAGEESTLPPVPPLQKGEQVVGVLEQFVTPAASKANSSRRPIQRTPPRRPLWAGLELHLPDPGSACAGGSPGGAGRASVGPARSARWPEVIRVRVAVLRPTYATPLAMAGEEKMALPVTVLTQVGVDPRGVTTG